MEKFCQNILLFCKSCGKINVYAPNAKIIPKGESFYDEKIDNTYYIYNNDRSLQSRIIMGGGSARGVAMKSAAGLSRRSISLYDLPVSAGTGVYLTDTASVDIPSGIAVTLAVYLPVVNSKPTASISDLYSESICISSLVIITSSGSIRS